MNTELSDPPALLTPTQMGRADAAAIASGIPGRVLMENAGRAVARAIRARFAPCRTVILCGPGNNGGDGYVVARLLADAGWPITVAVLAQPKPATDAAWAAAAWHGPMVPFAPAESARAGLVIDAVFGAGLARDVDGRVADTLRAAGCTVAIDMPSGVDGATGLVRGFARQAALTVTFFRRKPGHLLLPGRDLCGECVLAEIGIPTGVLDAVRPDTFANGPHLWSLPRLTASGHKYSRGHVTVLGGAMTGAARLAADAARHAGAGMVTIAARRHADTHRAGPPGLIVSDAPLDELLQDPRRDVWVCGPGLGPDLAAKTFPALVAGARKIIGDADLFSAYADQPDALRGATILTPHAGEFTRIFGQPTPDRLTAARAAAARTGAVLLLKGSDTIIAAPDGRAAINASAPPWLATAGSGDVLGGIIAGLLAQGMDPFHAAAAGAFLHGRAARIAGSGMVAEDLIAALQQAAFTTP